MDFVLIIFKNSGNLKYYHVALRNLLSCFFFQADCLEEGGADLQVFISVSNGRAPYETCSAVQRHKIAAK